MLAQIKVHIIIHIVELITWKETSNGYVADLGILLSTPHRNPIVGPIMVRLVALKDVRHIPHDALLVRIVLACSRNPNVSQENP